MSVTDGVNVRHFSIKASFSACEHLLEHWYSNVFFYFSYCQLKYVNLAITLQDRTNYFNIYDLFMMTLRKCYCNHLIYALPWIDLACLGGNSEFCRRENIIEWGCSRQHTDPIQVLHIMIDRWKRAALNIMCAVALYERLVQCYVQWNVTILRDSVWKNVKNVEKMNMCNSNMGIKAFTAYWFSLRNHR